MSNAEPIQPTEPQLLDALFQNLPGLACLMDETGRFVRWNRGYQRLLGLNDDEMSKLSGTDVVVPRDCERLLVAMRDVLAGNEVTFWCSLKVGDGEIPVHGTGALMKVGKQSFIFAAASDISAQLAAEVALSRSDHRLQAVFNATHDAMVVHDEDGRVLDVNDQWCSMFGCRREDAIDTNASRFAFLEPPYSRLEAHERVRLAAQVGPQVFEWPCTRVNGQLFWTEVALRAATIAEQKCVIAAVRDISERKRNEAALRASEERFRQLFDGAADAIFVHDRHGQIVDVNRAACVSLGYSRAELVRMSVKDIAVHTGGTDLAELWSMASDGTSSLVEGIHRRQDGTAFPVDVHVIPFKYGDDAILLSSARDISERKRAEAERQRLEESLRHAQKLESIGRLAGGIAHDFNNLLTAISGNLSLAMLGEGGKTAIDDMLFEASRAAESAAHLTRQLLTFSRKQVINPKLLCLNDTVTGLQKMLRRLLGEDIELCVRLGSDLGQVETDEGQIEQVLVNLAVNARDAMPNGGRLVIETASITVERQHSSESGPLQPGRYVTLLICDNGTGMSPEAKEHLFEPFFTTKEVGKGTGLGLAMVYGAVQQNHGHIAIDSELGRGTSIRIYLPRVDDPRKDPADNTRPALAGGVESIFVVEDEKQVRTLAVRILARQGYQVHAYGSGEDALAALSRMDQPVDLLLTDVIMPGMNGRDFAERAQRLRPGLRVLFTSGYTDDVIVRHGVLEQCIDFIPKPYSVECLTRRIREILDRAKATPTR
jgi:two-component system, cell cycle sensor histidine kinase and response regulator CckA